MTTGNGSITAVDRNGDSRSSPTLIHRFEGDEMETCEIDDTIVQRLGRVDAYPHRPETVEVKETHISWVFLAGDLVYKVKKPVHFDFLDFSTVERREQACRDEVRLNRRLAPDVYLDVVPITETPGGGLRFGGKGTPRDWGVRMRRLPDDCMLDALLHCGRLRPIGSIALPKCWPASTVA